MLSDFKATTHSPRSQHDYRFTGQYVYCVSSITSRRHKRIQHMKTSALDIHVIRYNRLRVKGSHTASCIHEQKGHFQGLGTARTSGANCHMTHTATMGFAPKCYLLQWPYYHIKVAHKQINPVDPSMQQCSLSCLEWLQESTDTNL